MKGDHLHGCGAALDVGVGDLQVGRHQAAVAVVVHRHMQLYIARHSHRAEHVTCRPHSASSQQTPSNNKELSYRRVIA